MRIKFLRMRPEICANTLWSGLFSSCTRNMPLGNGSKTVAITSIASSLLKQLRVQALKPNYDLLFRKTTGARRPCHTGKTKNIWPENKTEPHLALKKLRSKSFRLLQLFRQNQRPIAGDSHAVLKMRA